ncbi:Cof-type HAD-IIB family hydrolase [Domibacillus sp. DTU_2020_1001157_1_SI_ALB_TIR_016]|uniref:Cof-type HAD-IIB family hydrolase n=1 Tax=Domibacillus sp. DTU_2020_1001157_1_SI_ALB_TIR_016 TaxID=3077789 RepID=UPI0028E9A137|nr:Cof-type HAD-IIB family hydrolase [Domibacillus sp. DTU_2020_1001157_1_SI_ALB_TIR_016]WNS78777.1 Cof-type HAD-IIB family hydrolase [Domibacillus sp. DTU_2020_1001157_1_SI_ALB_TIR_016]
MGKQVVFLDLDGTLLNEEKVMPESNKKAVRLLQEKGIHAVIATGRTPQQFAHIREELNIHSYVSINGQYVVFEGEVIYTNPIDPFVLHDITNIAKSRGHAVAYCNHEAIKASDEDHPFIKTSFDKLKMAYPPVDRKFYKMTEIYQGHLYCDSQDEQLYEEQFTEFNFVRWDKYAADILPKGSSKAMGIEKILEAADVKKEDSYAFGDGLNDLEMLAQVGTGIAMGNAVPEAKAAADFVTDSNINDGILKGLIHFGLVEQKNENCKAKTCCGRCREKSRRDAMKAVHFI